MEQAVLLREEYDGGQRLIRRLIEQGFDVLAAFWTKRPDDTAWSLYVVSPRVPTIDDFTNHRALDRALNSLEDEWAHPFERLGSLRVRLLSPTDRLSEVVIDALAKYPLRLPYWHHVNIPWPNQCDEVLLCPMPEM